MARPHAAAMDEVLGYRRKCRSACLDSLFRPADQQYQRARPGSIFRTQHRRIHHGNAGLRCAGAHLPRKVGVRGREIDNDLALARLRQQPVGPLEHVANRRHRRQADADDIGSRAYAADAVDGSCANLPRCAQPLAVDIEGGHFDPRGRHVPRQSAAHRADAYQAEFAAVDHTPSPFLPGLPRHAASPPRDRHDRVSRGHLPKPRLPFRRHPPARHSSPQPDALQEALNPLRSGPWRRRTLRLGGTAVAAGGDHAMMAGNHRIAWTRLNGPPQMRSHQGI